MPALVIGSALAGAVQVLIPREALLAIGSNPALSIVAMIALAMVVSICSNVDAFFALSFASTFTPGSIVAFLLVGPARRHQDARADAHDLHDPHARGHRRRRHPLGVRDRDGGEPPCVARRDSSAPGGSGVGLASVLAVVTLGLALTGRLGLYINPDSTWFAVSMAVVVLVGAALSFALPLGAEADHGHDHGDAHAHDHGDAHDARRSRAAPRLRHPSIAEPRETSEDAARNPPTAG